MGSRDTDLLRMALEEKEKRENSTLKKTNVGLLVPVGSFELKAADSAVQEEGETIDNTPVVKITQARNKDLDDCDLYLTYTPTELCIGMAWRAKIRRIVYVQSINPLIIGTYTPSESAIGTSKAVKFSSVKVQGLDECKRVYVKPEDKIDLSVPELEKPAGIELTAEAAGVLRRKLDAILMLLAYALVGGAWNKDVNKSLRKKEGPRAFGNNIGSILVDSSNTIIGWGLNMKHVNATFHGETLMLQEYLKKAAEELKNDLEAARGAKTVRLPNESRLYTTLEPCFMCSGFIATAAKNLTVISGQNDPNISGPDKGKSALHREVNNCKLLEWEKGTGYKLKSFLEQMQATAAEIGDQKTIIDFLFGAGAEATYVDMLSVLPKVVQYKMVLSQDDVVSSLKAEVILGSKEPVEASATASTDARKIYDYLLAYLGYGIKFLNKLAEREVIATMNVSQDALTEPILKHIPLL